MRRVRHRRRVEERMARKYFEDFRPGETVELGSVSVSEAEIIAFGRQFDPQYFHTDPVAAKESVWGGLVASGWHSCGLFMRLMVDGFFKDVASLASPGVDELRWLRPVRPGDTLSGRITMLEATPSRSRPERGAWIQHCELRNQEGETVLTMRAVSFVARRPAQGA
jgi:acyl dehydratase